MVFLAYNAPGKIISYSILTGASYRLVEDDTTITITAGPVNNPDYMNKDFTSLTPVSTVSGDFIEDNQANYANPVDGLPNFGAVTFQTVSNNTIEYDYRTYTTGPWAGSRLDTVTAANRLGLAEDGGVFLDPDGSLSAYRWYNAMWANPTGTTITGSTSEYAGDTVTSAVTSGNLLGMTELNMWLIESDGSLVSHRYNINTYAQVNNPTYTTLTGGHLDGMNLTELANNQRTGWHGNFGGWEMLGIAQNTIYFNIVPEPSSCLMLILATTWGLSLRKRKKA